MFALGVLGLAAFLGTGAPAAGAAGAFPGQGFLPHDRAWELVSPPDKLGGEIISESQRTRAAAGGGAVGFMSLAGFGDARGTAIGVDYLARRSGDPDPGDNGWSTHAITPVQESPLPLTAIQTEFETLYDGEFSPDLDAGVIMSYSPLSADPNVEDVVNLYRRADLLSPGPGSYELLSACPLCEAAEPDTPLPPLPASGNPAALRPYLAWASPDQERIAFESKLNLTVGAPAQPGICNPAVDPRNCRARAYEWDEGELRLAGILDDPALCAAQTPSTGAPCAADGSMPGQGVGAGHTRVRAPHAVSDGADGHSRVFFTQPTDASGKSASFAGLSAGAQRAINGAFSGRLFMRLDGASTEQLNLSERDPLLPASPYAPATYLDASADGARVFFMTQQALTDDAQLNSQKIYMYDASRPGTDPANLTLLTPGVPGGDVPNAQGLIGASEDGRYVYMAVAGQLVDGEPSLTPRVGIYLWHEGAISFIGSVADGTPVAELLSSGITIVLRPQQARVAPDGRHLLFSAIDDSGLTGDDHGTCETALGDGCRQLYLYDADQDQLECASCDPGGAPATGISTTVIRTSNGGSQTSWHRNRALSDDGRYVFFSTAQRLVPEDTNGICGGPANSGGTDSECVDAYVYDTATGKHHLLSSGRDDAASYFLDASRDGSDAFFLTRERLSGWDFDGSYDLYDARVGGGFPEPPPPPPGCVGDACQPAPRELSDPTPGSATLAGPGDLRAAPRKARRCRRRGASKQSKSDSSAPRAKRKHLLEGKRRVKARGGKVRCVKRRGTSQKRKRARKNRANSNRRAGR